MIIVINGTTISWTGSKPKTLTCWSLPVREMGPSGSEKIAEGAEQRWEQIAERDTPLLLLRGLIRPSTHETRDCLAADKAPEACGGIAGDAHEPNPIETMDLPDTTKTLDMNPYLCPQVGEGRDATCSAVVVT